MILSLPTIRLLVWTGTALWLGGCSKSSDPVATPTRTELLTGPKWQMVASITTDTTNSGITVADNMPHILACDKDDLYKFTAAPARTFAIDKGAVICNPDVTVGYKGTWDFRNNESVLVYNPSTSYSTVFRIESLTNKQLVLTYLVNNTTSPPYYVAYYVTETFTAR